MIDVAIFSRLTLFIISGLILLAAIDLPRRGYWRTYKNMIRFIAAVNMFFYAASVLWRMGYIHPPGGDFFSTLSNIRSWFLAVFVLAAVVRTYYIDIWTRKTIR